MTIRSVKKVPSVLIGSTGLTKWFIKVLQGPVGISKR